MTDTIRPITAKAFAETEGLDDWRVVGDGACAVYRTGSMAESAALVGAIGKVSGVDGHPPAIDVRWDGVTVRLVTFVEGHGGMTERDAEIALAISEAAHGLGLTADPSAIQSLLIIPGAPDITAIMPFWQAVLGYTPRADSPEEDLVDPRDRGTPLWFERMEEARPGGLGAIHVACWLPRELAADRVQAALAAGGRMVRDEFAPSWWTLADAAGNEVDISTIGGREEG